MRLEPGLDKIDRILYDLNGVASLILKRIRGQSYWYARECQRVDGRPKIVWQQYLGRAQDLIDAVQGRRPAAGRDAFVTAEIYSGTGPSFSPSSIPSTTAARGLSAARARRDEPACA